MTRSALLAIAVLASVSLAACGGDEPAPRPGGLTGSSGGEGAGLEHVHGLGVNPADGSLFIATHTGLFRAGAKAVRATRVGTSQQDVMGFTVLGPNRFLGSGHPAPGQDLPPLLGLIDSSTAGRSWRPISLLGQADFHVLRSAGQRVYGFNSATGALMVSKDAGRSWATSQPPGPLIDLAIDPADENRVVSSTDQGLFTSRDAGRTWRPLARGAIGLLSWPRRDQLFWIDAQGATRMSADAGIKWRETGGTIAGQPAAFANHRDDLYAALPDGTVKRSVDDGRTWTVRATP